MIIESKKTKLRQYIPESDWQQMKKSGDYLHFNVIKRGDDNVEKPAPIPLPSVLEHIVKTQREAKEKIEAAQEKKYKPTKSNNGHSRIATESNDESL